MGFEKTVPVAEGSSETTTERYMENYKNVSQDIRDQLNAEAEAVQIILTGIDNDIYSTVDACVPNACEMSMAKNEVNEIRAERLARTANPLALVAQQQLVYHHQNHPTQHTQYSSTRSQQSTRNRGKAIVTSFAPTYDPKPATVTKDEEMSKEKEIDKLMALISLSFKKIYKPTNNNLRTSSNTSQPNQDNSLRINRGTGYDNQRAVNVAGARENVGTPVVQKKLIRRMILMMRSEEQELEATLYVLAQIQEVTPDPVYNSFDQYFDDEPSNKNVSNDFSKPVAARDVVLEYIANYQNTKVIHQELLRVIPTTNVSIPQLKSNQLEDRVMPNNSQGKKQNVEDHRRHFKTEIRPMAVPISTREPKQNVNQSVATSSKKTVATDSTVKKSRNITRKLYEQLVEIILFIVDSGCSKHMTGNLKLLTNFVEKFLGTVKFGNDQIAPILGYGDLVQGTITIKRVYYVEGLNHNLFSVGQFCDADLEVAFRKSTCYIRDLKGNDLLTGSRGTDLYSISLQDSTTPNPICLMAKATSSQAWLWHRRLSHLNFDTINLLSKNNIVNGLPKLKFVKDHLCSSCELGKAKRKSFHTKTTPSSKRWLQLLHMDLCGPMRVESINGKKYVLVIVDDYSRYTWTHFLRSKDETPGVLIDFLTLVQRGLHAQVTTVRTDKGTEFLNKTLHAYCAKEGIRHETSTA
ncbi:retrovirus-related pol polyprotein from transposon TNT 1-94 [Tanacetum coccineum]